MASLIKRFWGGAFAAERPLPPIGTDLLLLGGVCGIAYGFFHVAGHWTGVMRTKVDIDLSPWKLPWYAFLSLTRSLVAYVISLIFTLAYGYWAAKDRRAERVLIPMLDVLQSIPVLGFMPALILSMVALFPHSNVGLEMAAVLMIFTGQAWNMVFSFYRSLQTIPREQNEAALIFRFSLWQRFHQVELPSASLGLVWNSMMSMAGGWFFLMAAETFTLGDQDFRLPGLGSYMQAAVDQGQTMPQVYGVVTMTLMIVALDQVLWRPLVAWAQKFRVEEGGSQDVVGSWFLTWLRQSRILHAMARHWARLPPAEDMLAAVRRFLRPASRLVARLFPMPLSGTPVPVGPRLAPISAVTTPSTKSLIPLLVLIGLLLWGAVEVFVLIHQVGWSAWRAIIAAAGFTFLRVIVSTLIGTLWTVPAGLAIGLSPRLSRILQPVIQVLSSFPAPMLFAMIVGTLFAIGIPLGVGCIVLMLLGTQWYILFNVIAGSMAIPADLIEASRSYGLTGWRRFRSLYLPSIFPYLVTGWVTAMGGAWNASIIAETVTYNGQVHSTIGLGSYISAAAAKADLPQLAASILVMAIVVVGINRLVWHRLYRFASTRFSIDK